MDSSKFWTVDGSAWQLPQSLKSITIVVGDDAEDLEDGISLGDEATPTLGEDRKAVAANPLSSMHK